MSAPMFPRASAGALPRNRPGARLLVGIGLMLLLLGAGALAARRV